jgi:hypothetical protein
VKTLTKLSLLVLIFFLDVHLKAESVLLPKGCWGKQYPCAIENSSAGSIGLKLDGAAISLGHDGIVKATSEKEASLTKGTMFAKHEGDFQWSTPYGSIFCSDCEIILKRDESSLEVHALKGRVSVQRRGDEEKYDLPPGFSVVLSSVQADGKAELEFPQASALRPLAKMWASVYVESADEFKTELKTYIDTWKSAVEVASQMHKAEADRVLASSDEKLKAQERFRKQQELQNSKLRALFREKNDL